MQPRNNMERLILAGLVLGICLSVGCAKRSSVETSAPPATERFVERAATPEEQHGSAPAPALPDPATLLSYKTGVPRDKVEQILAIYKANAKPDDRGRDIFKLAVFASEKTGLTPSQVGSVILGFKALGGDSVSATEETQGEPKKG